jgi:hypothetical protein
MAIEAEGAATAPPAAVAPPTAAARAAPTPPVAAAERTGRAGESSSRRTRSTARPRRNPSRPSSTIDRYAWAFFLASLCLGVGVLLWSSARPYVQWPKTSDDMFYYFTLVRESVRHSVVSSEGLRPTNGFHPLYFLLLRAVYPLVPESVLPGIALAILAIAHGATCLALWATLRHLTGRTLAGCVAGLYAANPYVLGVVFAGVETALACLFVSLCLWAHGRWLGGGARSDRLVALVALGLAVAARTDTVMLAAALALGPSLTALRRPAAALRALDRAPLAVALLPVLAFGAWSQWATGEFLQTSGRSLSFWQSVGDWRIIRGALEGLGALASPVAAIAYALYVLVQFVAWLAKAPVVLLSAHPLGTMLVGAGIAARLGGDAVGETSTASSPGATLRRRQASELIAFLLLIWTFYALLFRHCQTWYWHTSVYATALLLGLWLTPLRQYSEPAGAWLTRLPRAAPALALLVAVGLSGLALDDLRPRGSPRAVDPNAAPASDPLAMVPDGAQLGAFDTGRLAWEQPRLKVVNLDGLVNNAAFRALRQRRIGRYMLEQDVEWLYVYDKVVDRFAPFGLGEWLAQADAVGRSASGVVLYRRRDSIALR